MNTSEYRLRYKRSPPVHYEALTYSAGRGSKTRRNHHHHQSQQAYHPHQQVPQSRRRQRSRSKPLQRKNTDALMEMFKVAASILLLSSSAYTYRDHLKFQPVDVKRTASGMKMHMNFPKSWVRSSSHRDEKQEFPSDVGGDVDNVDHVKNAEMRLPSFIQDETLYNNSTCSYDAYGIVDQFYKEEAIHDAPSSAENFIAQAQKLRAEFATHYGGERSARAILKRGMSSFAQLDGVDVAYTAKRIKRARDEERPFTFGFAGYSVTAGRGNYFHQSFPFVAERILTDPMKELGVDIQVRNAGIGGVPSFPYGFCLDNFLKGVPVDENVKEKLPPLDMVSWDFSMNEANDVVEGMEAYIRQVLTMDQDIKPMLLVKDTHMAVNRRALIGSYANAGLLPDAIVLHSDPATEPFLEIEEDSRPIGFQMWREFGGPPEAPGKSKHHPAVKEHELLGWMIAMHFLSALEMLLALDLGLVTSEKLTSVTLKSSSASTTSLPAPFFAKESDLSPMLYGSENRNGEWGLGHISCRTSFEPIVGGDLKDLIISTNANDSLDLMLPKGSQVFSKGWVLDLGDAEKKAKQQLNRYGGLGFLDAKKAYYGVFASGNLQLFIPHKYKDAGSGSIEGKSLLRGTGGGKILTSSTVPENSPAANIFTSIVLCESNEKRDPMACNMATDISYIIGGIEARDVKPIDVPGFSYLSRKICVNVKIPSDAKTSSNNDGLIGVLVDLSVSNKRIRNKEIACNLSHVIWQSKEARITQPQ